MLTMKQMFQIDPTLIHVLEENESHILPLDETGEETMTVTVIDANHCPGSVMYLFDGYFGRILYTGDMRYESWMLAYTAMSSLTNIDFLYLDNTYNCSASNFPTRAVAKSMICDIIRRHQQHSVVIGVRTLGKEELLECIAETFHTWIAVNPDYYKTLCTLKRRTVFTTNAQLTSIRAVPMHQVTRAALTQWNEDRPTIAIVPTALFFAIGMEQKSADMFFVPYSDHSSYDELETFVAHVKPRTIIPIVKGSLSARNYILSGITDMGRFSCHLDHTALPTYQVPLSVLQWMKTPVQTLVRRPGRPKKRKTAQRLRKRKMGCEFTDASPVKKQPNPPSADDHNVQRPSGQLRVGKPLVCVGSVQSSVKHITRSVTGNELRGEQPTSLCAETDRLQPSHDKPPDRDNLVCVGVVVSEKDKQSSPMTDCHVPQSHDGSHDKARLTCVGSVRPVGGTRPLPRHKRSLSSVIDGHKKVARCNVKTPDGTLMGQPCSGRGQKGLPACLSKLLPGKHCALPQTHSKQSHVGGEACSQTGDDSSHQRLGSLAVDRNVDCVSDTGHQIRDGVLSPRHSTETAKSVHIVRCQIVRGVLSARYSTETVKNVRIVRWQIKDGVLSPVCRTDTEKNVDIVSDTGDQSKGGVLSPSTETEKNVDNGEQTKHARLSSSQGSWPHKNADSVDNTPTEKNLNNTGSSSSVDSTVTDKNVVNDIGLSSPGESIVTVKDVDNKSGLSSSDGSTVTDRNVNNVGLSSTGESTGTKKEVVNNSGLSLPGENTVTDKEIVNNGGLSLPRENTVTDKEVVNNSGLSLPGETIVTVNDVVNNSGLSSSGETIVTNKDVVNNTGLSSSDETTVTDKDVVNNSGLSSPGETIVTVKDVVNNSGLSSSGETIVTKKDVVNNSGLSSSDGTIVTVKDVVNNSGLSSSGGTIVTVKDVVNNSGLSSPGETIVTDKDVDNNSGLSLPGETIVTNKEVVNNSGLSLPGETIMTVNDVVNNSGLSSSGETIVTNKDVVNNSGLSSSDETTVTVKDVDNNSGLSSSDETIVTVKDVDNNSGLSSSGETTVTVKDIVNNSGLSSPGETIVTNKDVVNNSGLSSSDETTVTVKDVVNNSGLSSSGETIVTNKEVVNNSGLSSPGETIVTVKDIVNNSGLSSPGETIVTVKDIVNNSGLSSPGETIVTVKDIVNNSGLSSPGETIVTVKDIVNNSGLSSPGETIVTVKDIVNNSGLSSPGEAIVTVNDVVNNSGLSSSGESTMTDKNDVYDTGLSGQCTVNNIGDQNEDGLHPPGDSCLPDVASVCENGTLPQVVNGRTVAPVEVAEACQQSRRFIFRRTARFATVIQHSDVEQNNDRTPPLDRMSTQQHGYGQTFARTRCRDSDGVLECSRAKLQKKTGGHSDAAAVAEATVTRPVRHVAVSGHAQELPELCVLESPAKSSQTTSLVDTYISQVRRDQTSCNIEMVTLENGQCVSEVNCARENDHGNSHDSLMTAQNSVTFRDTQAQASKHTRKSLEIKQCVNLRDSVVTSQIVCAKTLGGTPVVTGENTRKSPGDISTKEGHHRTSQEDVRTSPTRHADTLDDSVEGTFQLNVQRCLITYCRQLNNHSSVTRVRPVPQPQTSHQEKNATSANRTRKLHKNLSTMSSCERTRDGDNVSVYETDPDRLMDLMGSLLDEEAQKLDAGHSWLAHT